MPLSKERFREFKMVQNVISSYFKTILPKDWVVYDNPEYSAHNESVELLLPLEDLKLLKVGLEILNIRVMIFDMISCLYTKKSKIRIDITSMGLFVNIWISPQSEYWHEQ